MHGGGKGEAFNLKNIISTLKHGSGIMMWGCFAGKVTGALPFRK